MEVAKKNDCATDSENTAATKPFTVRPIYIINSVVKTQ